jgi:dipeptidyl-peptidase-4
MTTWPALDAQLLADAAATFNFRLGLPVPLAITADGAVLFRRTPPRAFASDLYELDTRTGQVRTLVNAAALLGAGDEQLSDAERARRERTRTATRGVVDIGVSDDGARIMVPLGGRIFLIERATLARHVIDPGDGGAYDPQLSRDGRQVAYVQDGDLWVAGLDHAPRRLTNHPPGLEYGVAEFAAQEELGRRRGFWWSPDGHAIVFQRTDARAVDTIYVADARHPDKVPVPFKYPRAGTTNATVDLGIVATAGGEPRWLTWDLARLPYLVSVHWPVHGPLAALVLDRDQQQLELYAFDPATAARRTLLTERDDAWLNVNVGVPRWLDDGSFLWMTERPGAWILEHRAADGALVRALTTPDLGLRAVVGVIGADAGTPTFAIVLAAADSPEQHVWQVPLAGGAPLALTTDGGVHGATVDHGLVVLQSARRDGGQQVVAVAADGTRHPLPSVAERPSLVPTTVRETVMLDGRTHHVAITRPRAFDPERRYPVLLKVYAGPHLTTVTDARDAYVMDQWYADAGFIVVRSDNRGTPDRGRAWERAILRDLLTVALDDQVGALQAVASRHPELDLARVGVFGWSFGGYFATLALLLRPDLFKAAIAGAPVTDWGLYDTAYTERYMKTPAQNPDGYARTSALTHAAKLARPLLIIHGITDDNVHFANALALIEALYVAGKRAEVVTLSATHMVPDPKLNLAREQLQVDFFRTHL